MTHIRIIKSGPRKYRQLVQSVWDSEKQRSRSVVLASLGRVSDEATSFDNLTPVTNAFPYMGSKTRLSSRPEYLDIIRGIEFNRYLEPFAGSCAIYLSLAQAGLLNRKELIVLSDSDGEIANFNKQVQQHPKKVANQVAQILYSQGALDEPPKLNLIERAAQFAARLNLQMMGVSRLGKGRLDTRGMKKAAAWEKYPERIMALAQYFKKAAFLNWDCLEFIQKFDSPDALFVCDPPYMGRKFYDQEFKLHEELSARLTECRGAVILHHAEHPRLRELYPEAQWTYHSFEQKPTGLIVKKGGEKAAKVEWVLVKQ